MKCNLGSAIIRPPNSCFGFKYINIYTLLYILYPISYIYISTLVCVCIEFVTKSIEIKSDGRGSAACLHTDLRFEAGWWQFFCAARYLSAIVARCVAAPSICHAPHSTTPHYSPDDGDRP